MLDRLIDSFGAQSGRVVTCERLSGGAIQQNWRVDLAFCGGRHDGRLSAVLRSDSDSLLDVSRTRSQEYRLFQAAYEAGVTVPEPLCDLSKNSPLDRPAFLLRRMDGVAAGHALVKTFATGNDALCQTLGEQLARIHAIDTSQPRLAFLGAPPADPVAAWVVQLRATLDRLDVARPIIELGLRYLEIHKPDTQARCLCHNDFRTGNYLVERGTLSAILDWEFAGWGDPMQDVGWFSAPCWRFGARHHAAGGLGSLEAFLSGYRAAGGAEPRMDELVYWHLLATLRWAVIALAQAARRHTDSARPLELALTQHIVPELERDVLQLIEGLPS